jgi:2-polyprenyl-6-hydroxyphenyl methylase/3-demethylubiquinone-9 3-methyltransferase
MPQEKRFAFGANWESFARNALNADRVAQARADFGSLLRDIEQTDRTFLDIGFGQGLVAAMATEAGARVTAIDIDADCHKAYKITRQYFPGMCDPEILIGSILDRQIVTALQQRGQFDIVHSWGVLHHTGDMWRALENAASLVKPGGHLVIAIYARHWTSAIWKAVKWSYVHAPVFIRRAMVTAFLPLFLVRRQQLGPGRTATRGMEFRHDLIDWIGGYPYEYASPDEIRSRLSKYGFKLLSFRPTIGMTGCHEYIFERPAA